MHKKAIAALVDSIVKRVVNAANEAASDEPALEEAEARTLVGIHLRKNASAIVNSICGIEEEAEARTLVGIHLRKNAYASANSICGVEEEAEEEADATS